MTSPPDTRKNRLSRLLRLLLPYAGALIVWLVLYVGLRPGSLWLTRDLLGLDPESRFGSAVVFFAYEAPKVLLLLVLVVFMVGIMRSFFTPERTREMLAGRRQLAGNTMAAGLGVVTPFCSCSAVPLFIGFVTAGVPLGVTFSFLVAAPMVNEVALALLFGLFGWRIGLAYLGTGLAIAIAAGWVIGRLRLERHVEPWVFASAAPADALDFRLDWSLRLRCGRDAVQGIVGRVWPFLLVGIAVGAFIHGYVPEAFLASLMGKDAWWSVPAAVLVGVPLYSNAAGVIPVMLALLEKGAAFGTTLAFMMSVIALSLPEMIILRKVLRPALIATFIGVVAAGIVLVGVLFNWLV
jgi:uncharacterized membrane protein YraQ (UPF0718 family)